MMTDFGRIRGDLNDDPGAAAEPTPVARKEAKPSVLDQLGGPVGAVYAGLPVVVFVIANSVVGLGPAIGIAIGFAVLTAVVRLVRKEPVTPALSGVLGVAVASFVAHQTGSAKGFFLVGIWGSLLMGSVLLVSVLVRRPLAGVLASQLTGKGDAWRGDRPSLRAYDLATLALTAVFAARFVVQQWLYDADNTGWLAVAKIAMGYPLLALALLVVLWAYRRSTQRLKAIGATGATA